MNKKEVLEIRKLLNKDRCRIERICGCYVDGHKEKKLEMKEAFLSLPEEEMFKYIDIFKRTLSGTIGKNLLNLEFPLEAELGEGRQKLLLALLSSGTALFRIRSCWTDFTIRSSAPICSRKII